LGFEFSASRRAAEAQRFFMRLWIGAGCVDSRVPSSLDIPCWLLDIQFVWLTQRVFILQPKVARSRATLGSHRNMIIYPNGIAPEPFTPNDATPLV
jgi:hypothetical protein